MYCTPEDVRGELYLPIVAQMTAKFPGNGEFDAFLERHIAAATNFADAMLSRMFPVPLHSPVPEAIRTAVAKEAAYYAAAQFSEQEELMQDRHITATAILEAFVTSGQLPGSEIPSRRVVGGSDAQVFTKSVLDLW